MTIFERLIDESFTKDILFLTKTFRQLRSEQLVKSRSKWNSNENRVKHGLPFENGSRHHS